MIPRIGRNTGGIVDSRRSLNQAPHSLDASENRNPSAEIREGAEELERETGFEPATLNLGSRRKASPFYLSFAELGGTRRPVTSWPLSPDSVHRSTSAKRIFRKPGLEFVVQRPQRVGAQFDVGLTRRIQRNHGRGGAAGRCYCSTSDSHRRRPHRGSARIQLRAGG